ncbi:AAA family ATPase [Methylobacterium komagatae]|uniref:AAA family ATPase n=1 Tax=Methylobacterium komagatae TaxID=374425 RepID=A0ABW2BSN3_9HYPH
MTPKIAGEGHSFKGSFAYYLNDKRADASQPHPTTSNRVEWTETRNLGTDDLHMAWRIMRATHAQAEDLKHAAGVRNTGRKATAGPVFAYSLAWEPAAKATLTREEMRAFADRSIKALKASHLQAVIVCHNDTAHPHVHVIINRVDPTTGKTHPFGRSQTILSDLAARYERERGQIVTPKRQKAAEAREAARNRPAYENGPSASWARDRREKKARQQAEGQQADVALSTLTRDRSTFTRQDLARYVYRHTDSADTFRAVLARLEASPELVAVGQDEEGRERFTTRDHQTIERRMLDHAVTLHGRTARAVRAIEPKGLTLTEDQTAALAHVLGPERLSLIVGIAGTGKSTMMGAARESWEAAGLTVKGVALSGIATDSLKAGSGIDSKTIRSRLWRWEQGQDLPTRNDVIVVDEAGMIGSRQMERILAFARKGRAKVVLIGDPEQLQAIEAGGAFRMMADRFGAANIDTVRRQRETWQQEATRELATASTAAAVERYEAAGMVHAHKTHDDAKAALVAAWRTEATTRPEASQIILAYKRVDVRDLNDRARTVRREAGELGPDHALETATGKRDFAAADRIYFLKNDAGLGVRNGTLATVERIERKTVTVRLDSESGRRVTFSTDDYNHIDHGYAATIHKSQGVTVDRAHLLASRNLDRHSTYVAMSRHRDRVDVHYSAEDFDSRDAMTKRLGRASLKDTSLDYEAKPPASRPAPAPVQNRQTQSERHAGGADMAQRQMSEQAAKSPRLPEETPKALDPAKSPGEALKRAHDAQKARHAAERAKLWPDQQARRAAILDAAKTEIRAATTTAKAESRKALAEQQRRQQAERERFEKRERHLTGKVRNAIEAVTARQIRGDGSDRRFITMAAGYLASKDARRTAFEARQNEAGRLLSDSLKTQAAQKVGQIKEARDRQLAESRTTFAKAKADMTARHGQENKQIRGEWNALYAERDRKRAEGAERAQAQATREAERERMRRQLDAKTARRDGRAAWSDEQTRRADVSNRMAEARPVPKAPAPPAPTPSPAQPHAPKQGHDRPQAVAPTPPPVPKPAEVQARPAPTPAGIVPPVTRAPPPVPARKDWAQAPPAPRPTPNLDWTKPREAAPRIPAPEPQARKIEHERGRDTRPAVPPAQSRAETFDRPTPAGNVPPVKREPSPVPPIDKTKAAADRQQGGPQAPPVAVRKDWTQAATPQRAKPNLDWTKPREAEREPSQRAKDWTQRAAPPAPTPTSRKDWTKAATPARHTSAPSGDNSDDKSHDIK